MNIKDILLMNWFSESIKFLLDEQPRKNYYI